MIIGVLSDSHGHVPLVKKATSLFKSQGVEAVLHAGDIGSMEVLEAIVQGLGGGVPVYAVLGNMDKIHLMRPSPYPTIHVRGRFLTLSLDGKSIALLHGDQESQLKDAVQCGRFDFVFTGHTHVAKQEHEGKTRWINPGAIHRAAQPSVAVVDLHSGQVRFLNLV
ncbi:MAG: YfcE family phosphodiesterase [Lentisphaerota bacterium]